MLKRGFMGFMNKVLLGYAPLGAPGVVIEVIGEAKATHPENCVPFRFLA